MNLTSFLGRLDGSCLQLLHAKRGKKCWKFGWEAGGAIVVLDVPDYELGRADLVMALEAILRALQDEPCEQAVLPGVVSMPRQIEAFSPIPKPEKPIKQPAKQPEKPPAKQPEKPPTAKRPVEFTGGGGPLRLEGSTTVALWCGQVEPPKEIGAGPYSELVVGGALKPTAAETVPTGALVYVWDHGAKAHVPARREPNG